MSSVNDWPITFRLFCLSLSDRILLVAGGFCGWDLASPPGQEAAAERETRGPRLLSLAVCSLGGVLYVLRTVARRVLFPSW